MPAARNIFQDKYLEIVANSPYIASARKPGRKIIGLQTYVYNVVVGTAALPLTLNTPRFESFRSHADSDFVLSYLSASANTGANGEMQYNRNITLQIQDTSTGKLFFSQPTVMTLAAGAGGFPFNYAAPRVIDPNTTIQVTMMNRDTITNYFQGFVSFGGTRIFYAG